MKTMRTWGVVLVAAPLGACAPSGIKADFAAINGCDKSEVKVKGVDAAHYRVSGCGTTTDYFCPEGGGCESPRFVVTRRHASQFRCSRTDVRVRRLEEGLFIAEGCGPAVTYQCIEGALPSEPTVRCIAETAARTD